VKRVFICSPYHGDIERNLEIARKLSRAVALQGHMPIAPHLLFPQFLDDNDDTQRDLAMAFCQELVLACDAIVVYTNGGISPGMRPEIDAAYALGKEFMSGVEIEA